MPGALGEYQRQRIANPLQKQLPVSVPMDGKLPHPKLLAMLLCMQASALAQIAHGHYACMLKNQAALPHSIAKHNFTW